MKLRFTKMQGLGNDFVVIDGVRRSVTLEAGRIRRLADRRLGVGCDQVLLAEPAQRPGCDFRYRIFNADGGEVEQCGNGVRCLGRFLLEEGLAQGPDLTVETLAGDTRIVLRDDGLVAVDMGIPRLAPAEIPFIAHEPARRYALQVGGRILDIGAVSMGNPHAITVVDDVQTAPIAELGPLIERHGRFPKRVNAGFMQVLARDHIRLRVYERGAGETPACGTGACAAVVAGGIQGLLDDTVTVDLPGGTLQITWPGPGLSVLMTGPAVSVFRGEIELS